MLKITLPQLVVAAYAVPIPDAPADSRKALEDAVNESLSGQVRDLTLRLLNSPATQVEVYPMEEFPVPLDVLQVMGATPEHLAKIKQCKNFFMMHIINMPVWPPYHEIGGRAAAASLALQSKTVVVDALVPMVIPPSMAVSNLPDVDTPIRLADWVTVITSMGDNGLWMSTKGLTRLGLPELQALDVPPNFMGPWAAAMLGLALNVVGKYSQDVTPDSLVSDFELPEKVTVTEEDIATASGAVTTGSGKAEICLKLDAANEENGISWLTVIVPPGDSRSFADYISDSCQSLYRVTLTY